MCTGEERRERMEEKKYVREQEKNVIRESNALAQGERKVFEGWGVDWVLREMLISCTSLISF